MPTVHVTPGSDLLLQDIANSLYKAKKVVVVTGAGISTNSGIPVSRTRRRINLGLWSSIG
jgi:NAD-dependent SIR2 family protein deacetylase